jgi:hypothetical protein
MLALFALAQLPEFTAVVEELSGRLDAFFGQCANPRWDLWKGGVAKSNSTPALFVKRSLGRRLGAGPLVSMMR